MKIDAMQPFGFSVLVVDDEPEICTILKKALSKKRIYVVTAASLEEAEVLRKSNHFDLLIVDINLPGRSGIDWHEAFSDETRSHDVIFMTGYGELETAIKALRAGASDFILKPFNLEQMIKSVQRSIDKQAMERQNQALKREVSRSFPVDIIGEAPKTQAMRKMISQLAPSHAAVLIEGESGTGKELVARALHGLSGRSGSFVPLNCAAISAELLESELFGHISGAFTGARKNKDGLFRVADKGTLFLDEISEMPHPMQASLLRVLEEKTIRPVGAEREIRIDVRIVAATNRSLKEEVRAGHFRNDLYYRLNVLCIELPPLRSRIEDIEMLLNYFSNALAQDMGLKPVVWSSDELNLLRQYAWPGNIRELKNTVERAILLGTLHVQHSDSVHLRNDSSFTSLSAQSASSFEDDISSQTELSSQKEPQYTQKMEEEKDGGYPVSWLIKDVERAHIEKVLDAHQGNKSSASRQLGLARKTIERKFKQWQNYEQDHK